MKRKENCSEISNYISTESLEHRITCEGSSEGLWYKLPLKVKLT